MLMIYPKIYINMIITSTMQKQKLLILLYTHVAAAEVGFKSSKGRGHNLF